MGLVNQTITFTAGVIPTASQWSNQFSTLYNLVNGNLDSANVDKTSADGIMVLDTAQTRTATLTMSAANIVMASGGLVDLAGVADALVLDDDGDTTISAPTDDQIDIEVGGSDVATLTASAFTLASGMSAVVNTVTIATGSITCSSGAISFGNENLSTTGTLTASGGGALTGTWSDLGTVTTVDLNGGTIDGVVIGGASAAAGTFTTITGSGVLAVTNSSAELATFDANGSQALAQVSIDASGSSGTGRAELQINAKSGVGSRLDFQQAGSTQWLVGAGAASDGTVFEFFDGSANVLRLTQSDNVIVGSGALATNATDGFLYIPTCAGTPSGTPSSYSGLVPLVFDSSNNELYIYDSGWISVALS